MIKKISLESEKEQRLDCFLRLKLPECIVSSSANKDIFSNSKIRRLILAGAVKVNGHIVKRPAFELRAGSSVDITFDEERFFYEKQPDDISFEMTDEAVLFEDENLIFVNKPNRFPVEQTITGNRSNLHDCLVDYLWRRNPSLRNPPYVGIMHRLDRETSGVILFTKTRSVNAEISEIFQKHDLTKQYLAVVEEASQPESGKRRMEAGKMLRRNILSKSQDSSAVKREESDPETNFTVEMFMGRVTGKSQQGKWGELPEAKGGQYSRTDFRVLKHLTVEGKACLLIECTLYTGRTHQIRLHLASQGLPILGDSLYGGAAASRLYLHSARLAFNSGEKKYDVTSPFLP